MSEEIDSQDDAMDDWGAALAEQAETEKGAKPSAAANVQVAELDALESDNLPMVGGDDRNLDMILDIPVTIAMEIGRTKISIRNLLQLNQGSVVELDRLAGEPM
ncbi:MAG: FliM/FliN family flagellar motor switch protein, partial [Thiohalobacteraceae bacterium]